MTSSKASRTAFVFLSAIFLGLVLGLVWAMALRENAARRLDLEFEVYRSSTMLVEEFLQDPESMTTGSSVIGLGIYSLGGEPIYHRGSAPESFRLERPFRSSFLASRDGRSIVLVRPLGANEGPLRSMMRGMMGQSPLPPRNRGSATGPAPRNAPPAPGPASAPQAGQGLPRVLWMEFSSGASAMASLFTFGAAALISLGIGGLYVLLVGLYRRNLVLLEREAKNRELIQLGEAARTLAHEIKNPLAVIRIQTASVRRLASAKTASGGDDIGERASIIDEEVDRITTLSDRIREFLKSGEGEPVVVDLGAFLADFATRYGAQGGEPGSPGIVLSPLPPGLELRADPARLGQALDNVARNAFEAGAGASAAGSPGIRIGVSVHGRLVDISVDDEGPGVASDLEPRLFEPFFTTKEKGSGIGLALARRIAEQAGGSLCYRRRAGGGASFVFSFPLLPRG